MFKFIITSNVVISSSCFAEESAELFRSACHTCSTLICPHSTKQILNFWRYHCRSCCRCSVAHFYHICYITVCISKRETRFIIQVHGHISTEQYKNIRQPFLRSYCCRNPNNCPPFCCHFPILQQRLNDRVGDTIAN